MTLGDSARMRLLVLGSALWVLGCAATTTGSANPPATPFPSAVAPAAAAPAEAWLTKLDADNALVGKLWDVKAGAFVEPALAVARLVKARFVLLGERHDNPDHHRLQARVVEQLTAAGRRPALVFEMLEVSQQLAVDQYLARPDATAAGFGAALGWEHTSWPAFSEYQPIFTAALARKLRIFAGNVAQADARALVKQGMSALPAERVQELRLADAFPAPLEAALEEELRASHCGQLPEQYLAPMALAQHARDAQMAKVLSGAGAQDGAVLISGGGHARLDRGVPYYLALDAPQATVASLDFREVRHADIDAAAYAAEEGPFDYVWFTPRHTDDDPCAGFKPPGN